jgi:hypothetical protein
MSSFSKRFFMRDRRRVRVRHPRVRTGGAPVDRPLRRDLADQKVEGCTEGVLNRTYTLTNELDSLVLPLVASFAHALAWADVLSPFYYATGGDPLSEG